MKTINHYMDRQISMVGVTTIFPGTRDDVMLTIETEKKELVFNLEHSRAMSLGAKMIAKAIPDPKKRREYLLQIMPPEA